MNSEMPTQEDRFLILQTLNGLPPLEDFFRAHSPDQTERLAIVREHFQDLEMALSAFFSGVENPVGKDDPFRKRMVEADVRRYLQIYELFWFGWDAIRAEVQQKQKETPEFWFPNSPGEALSSLMLLDCNTMTHKIFSAGQISVKESRKLLASSPSSAESVGLAKKRADRTERYATEMAQHNFSDRFLGFCEKAVKKRLRGNPTLKSVLMAYRKNEANRGKELCRVLKTNSVRGERWDLSGNRLENS